jgi:hypothetical protein
VQRVEKTLRAFAHPTEIRLDHENVIDTATMCIDHKMGLFYKRGVIAR